MPRKQTFEIPENGKFRYLRNSWNKRTPWTFSPFISDEEAVSRGYVLGGQGRDASKLPPTEQKELFELLKYCPAKQKPRLAELLGKVPYVKYVGIIDIDINSRSKNYTEHEARKEAERFVKLLAYYAPEFGLGNPNWYSTGWDGGFHADLITPDHIIDAKLLAAVKLMVTRLADHVGIPLYLRQPGEAKRNKYQRIPVYLDDSVLNKYPQSKGGLWRLVGTAKPGGKAKTLINPLLPGCPEIAQNEGWTPIDGAVLLKALDEVKTNTEAYKEPAILLDDPGPLSEEDMDFLHEHLDLVNIWEQKKVSDRSYRDFEFIMHALYLGADEAQACRLMRAMPGSKAKLDCRGIDYDRSIIGSARRCLANPYDGVGKYSDYVKPYEYSGSEKAILYEAAEQTENSKLKKKLLATVSCGQTVIRAEDAETGSLAFSQVQRCERATCPYCTLRRLYLQIENATETWPETLTTISFKLAEDTPNACKAALSQFKTLVKKTLRKRDGRKILSRILAFRGPGELLVVYPGVKQYRKLLALSSAQSVAITPRTDCLKMIQALFHNRLKRIANLVKAENTDALLSDPWLRRVVSVSGGKKARKRLDWLSAKRLRREASDQANAARGITRPDRLRYHLVSKRTGNVIASRVGIPFSPKDIRRAYQLEAPPKSSGDFQRPPD